MPREGRPANDDVQFQLERLILRGELAPGEHVKEQILADRLKVGRAPIREAARALEGAGLLRRIPNRGVFVREVGLSSATDVFDIRAELAGIVGREAVHNVNARTFDELTAMIAIMDNAAAELRVDDYAGLNLQFHERLYSLADNRRVAELDRALGREMLIYRRRGLASGGGLQQSNAEHRRILDALRRGRGDELAAVLRQHIMNGKRRFLLAMGSEPGADPAVPSQAIPTQATKPQATKAQRTKAEAAAPHRAAPADRKHSA